MHKARAGLRFRIGAMHGVNANTSEIYHSVLFLVTPNLTPQVGYKLISDQKTTKY